MFYFFAVIVVGHGNVIAVMRFCDFLIEVILKVKSVQGKTTQIIMHKGYVGRTWAIAINNHSQIFHKTPVSFISVYALHVLDK